MKKSRMIATSLMAVLIVLTASLSGTAFAAATPAVAANYKGVVFYVTSEAFQLSPECYTNNWGTKEQLAGSAAMGHKAMHFPYVWCENMGIAKDLNTPIKKQEALADQKVAARYFRVSLKKDQKIGSAASANFAACIKKGEAPGFVFAWDGLKNIPLSTKACPADTTKIFYSSWMDDYNYSNRYKKTDLVNQAALYVAKLTPQYDKVAQARPKAKFYVGSMELQSENFPRIDNPKLMSDALMTKWGSLIGFLAGEKAFMLDSGVRTEINKQIAAYCTKKGYIFVDLSKAGVTNAGGLTLEKYCHPNGVGFQLNQAGITLYGDYICKAMGLPTAKVMYKLK